MPITTSEKKRLAAEANKPKKRTPSEIALQQETFANALFEGATLTNMPVTITTFQLNSIQISQLSHLHLNYTYFTSHLHLLS